MVKLASLAVATLLFAGAALNEGIASGGGDVRVDAANCPGPGNGTKQDPFCSIQDAVDSASSGDRIVVAAGIYDEQVAVTKNLTISGGTSEGADHGSDDKSSDDGGGSEGATIIRPSAVIANTSHVVTGLPIAAILLVEGTTNAKIERLTVDGSAAAFNSCSPGYVGVFYRNASGGIESNEITHVFHPSAPGCQTVLGILVQSGGGTSMVSIRKNRVSDYGKNGITCNEVGTSCDIERNVVTGLGPVPLGFAAQNGVQIGPGARGDVKDNEISDHFYLPFTFSSTDILYFGPGSGPHRIEDNRLAGSLVNLFHISDDGVISDNRVTGSNAFGIFSFGSGTTFDKNRIGGSSALGLGVVGDGNQIEKNDAQNNPGDGVEVSGNSNWIVKNKAKESGGVGIRVAGTSNTATGNDARKNGGLDIENAGANVYTKNKCATSSGPPVDCGITPRLGSTDLKSIPVAPPRPFE